MFLEQAPFVYLEGSVSVLAFLLLRLYWFVLLMKVLEGRLSICISICLSKAIVVSLFGAFGVAFTSLYSEIDGSWEEYVNGTSSEADLNGGGTCDIFLVHVLIVSLERSVIGFSDSLTLEVRRFILPKFNNLRSWLNLYLYVPFLLPLGTQMHCFIRYLVPGFNVSFPFDAIVRSVQ